MSDPIFLVTYTVDLDYESPYYPSRLTINDGMDLESNTVIFYCSELDAVKQANPDLYYDYCIYMTLKDNEIYPKTKEYLPMVKDRLNFQLDDVRFVIDDDSDTIGMVRYQNDLQRIFNNDNNIYLGSCPTVSYECKTYSLLPISKPLPEPVAQYVKDVCYRARQNGIDVERLLLPVSGSRN